MDGIWNFAPAAGLGGVLQVTDEPLINAPRFYHIETP